ncbi:hypothetical protein RSOL_260260 [Rhizoctonia solani AG-3 Rhs1AP]|uniref:Uncharacterized protein n=1 Tax=Rhizoctonia solani AG-3 Rhs1AP TaxID=1086054 RepID=A0A0A1UJA5_9AGAM|nr:hypothetical protein RSOL_260260 [Rhizoctonia solani AG-3 Rhs1AP]
MAKYNGHQRKRRSSAQKSQAQKAQLQSLARFSEPKLQVAEHNNLDGLPLARPDDLNATTSVDNLARMRNKQISSLTKSCKNAIQREKRAKSKVTKLDKTVDNLCEQLSESCQARERVEILMQGLQAQADVDARELELLRNSAEELEHVIAQQSQELVRASVDLENRDNLISSLRKRNGELLRDRDSMRKKIQRMKTRNSQQPPNLLAAKDETPQFYLKHKGIIRPEVRDMIRKLACQGVSTHHVTNVIDIVAEGLGVVVVGSISARSVARIMLEGLIQARIQLAYELSQANSISICLDGTSIKNVQHEAKAIYIRSPEDEAVSAPETRSNNQSVLRTLGVHKAPNHTAQQQLNGWISTLNTCCNVFSRSPLGKNQALRFQQVAPKLRGVLTDHAADQKRFCELLLQWKQTCDREFRASNTLKEMTVAQQLDVLSKHLDTAANQMGNWRTLPTDEQATLMHDAWFAMAAQMGNAEFQKLNPDEQFEVDFLAWSGCCMHKELNAVKGGVTAMTHAWKEHNLIPPCTFPNKFEVEKASQLKEEKGARGAVKLASLAGALFNNKDDNKGYQNTVDFFFEKTFGYSNRFPDTSNTRYGSYCDAAVELLLHRKEYIELLATQQYFRSTSELNNIEKNVSRGLQDVSTLTELAVLALYAQAVGKPYMQKVRDSNVNGLSLGPFHNRVKQHCRAIIKEPDLLLGSDASYQTGSLDGSQWDRPDVVYTIQWLASQLPDLRLVVIAFFSGALSTWERFTSEFDSDDSVIARATPKQRESAWVPPTNDISEGSLGQCRQMLRIAPTMTDEQRNARVMLRRNDTFNWAKHTLSDNDQYFIKHEARALDSSGMNKKVRMELNSAFEDRAAANRERKEKVLARKSANKKRLDEVNLLENVTYEEMQHMRVIELDLQIDKLRESGDPYIRPKTMIGNKAAKIRELLSCFERRAAHISDSSCSLTREENSTTGFPEIEDGIGVDNCTEDIELSFEDEVIF